ncbi:hypothetical protein AX14_009089, partial [Amanita brunnescens Koide BX004]
LYSVTLNNTSVNGTICKTIAKIHKQQSLEAWDHMLNQCMCMAHVINLATMDVMSHITKTAVLENKTAIWEYGLAPPTASQMGVWMLLQPFKH